MTENCVKKVKLNKKIKFNKVFVQLDGVQYTEHDVLEKLMKIDHNDILVKSFDAHDFFYDLMSSFGMVSFHFQKKKEEYVSYLGALMIHIKVFKTQDELRDALIILTGLLKSPRNRKKRATPFITMVVDVLIEYWVYTSLKSRLICMGVCLTRKIKSCSGLRNQVIKAYTDAFIERKLRDINPSKYIPPEIICIDIFIRGSFYKLKINKDFTLMQLAGEIYKHTYTTLSKSKFKCKGRSYSFKDNLHTLDDINILYGSVIHVYNYK